MKSIDVLPKIASISSPSLRKVRAMEEQYFGLGGTRDTNSVLPVDNQEC